MCMGVLCTTHVPSFLYTESDDKLGKGVWKQGCYMDCIHVSHIVCGAYHYQHASLYPCLDM